MIAWTSACPHSWRKDYKQRWITGASAGIGAIYADRLAKRGYDLILVARNEERLTKLANRLATETGRSVTAIAADLNDKKALAKIETILRDDASITLLVNNAGVGAVASTLKGSDVDEMEAMIGLNITALTRLTYAVAPSFVARGTGTIVNIGSVVGIAVELLNGVYSASKSYVLSFGHALQRDLKDKGVRVQTVLPAATATEFWDVAGYAPQKTASSTMSADDLVDAALERLRQYHLRHAEQIERLIGQFRKVQTVLNEDTSELDLAGILDRQFQLVKHRIDQLIENCRCDGHAVVRLGRGAGGARTIWFRSPRCASHSVSSLAFASGRCIE